MTSYLRMMGTGSVRPEGKETESRRGEFVKLGRGGRSARRQPAFRA